jgi:hypothetical protein
MRRLSRETVAQGGAARQSTIPNIENGSLRLNLCIVERTIELALHYGEAL